MSTHLPVEGGFLNEDIHGTEQQVVVRPERSQGADHRSLHQSILLEWHREVADLSRQAERHQLRHLDELQRK